MFSESDNGYWKFLVLFLQLFFIGNYFKIANYPQIEKHKSKQLSTLGN